MQDAPRTRTRTTFPLHRVHRACRPQALAGLRAQWSGCDASCFHGGAKPAFEEVRLDGCRFACESNAAMDEWAVAPGCAPWLGGATWHRHPISGAAPIPSCLCCPATQSVAPVLGSLLALTCTDTYDAAMVELERMRALPYDLRRITIQCDRCHMQLAWTCRWVGFQGWRWGGCICRRELIACCMRDVCCNKGRGGSTRKRLPAHVGAALPRCRPHDVANHSVYAAPAHAPWPPPVCIAVNTPQPARVKSSLRPAFPVSCFVQDEAEGTQTCRHCHACLGGGGKELRLVAAPVLQGAYTYLQNAKAAGFVLPSGSLEGCQPECRQLFSGGAAALPLPELLAKLLALPEGEAEDLGAQAKVGLSKGGRRNTVCGWWDLSDSSDACCARHRAR